VRAGRLLAATLVLALAAATYFLSTASTGERGTDVVRSPTEPTSPPRLAPSLAPAPPSPEPKSQTPTDDKASVVLLYANGDPVEGQVEIGLAMKGDPGVATSGTHPGGAFDLVVERPGTYEVTRLEIEGKPYPYTSDLPAVELRTGSGFRLVLAPPCKAVFEVVDSSTKAPVQDARAFRYVPAQDEHFTIFATPIQIPTASTLAGTAVSGDREGRVHLPAFCAESRWYVVAPGKAWASVEARLTAEGKQRVELHPGGSLAVEIPRWKDLVTPTVDGQWGSKGRPHRPAAATTIDAPEGALDSWEPLPSGPFLELPAPDESGRLRLDGLPVGLCGIAVRRGPSFRDGERYGSGSVEIRTGETAALTIDVDPTRVDAPVPVRGAVRVPEAWDEEHVVVFLEGNDEKTAGTGRSSRVALVPGQPTSFELDPVPPGKYELWVYPTEWRTWIRVPPRGARLDLSVPPPCAGEVQVVDGETGATITRAEVRWGYHLEGDDGDPLQEAEHDSDTDCYRFQAPAGPVRLSAVAEGYQRVGFGDRRVEVRLAPGTVVRRVLEMRRAGTIVVRAHLDGKPLEQGTLAGSFLTVQYETDEESGVEFGSLGEGDASFTGLAPREWTVSLGGIPGFRAVEPRKVELRAGETVEVVFDLERER
jgi:hypothetical protein